MLASSSKADKEAKALPVQLDGVNLPNVGQHFAIRVEDLDAVVAELRAHAQTPSDPSPVGSSRQAFISDPSGNVVELHEVVRPPEETTDFS